MGLLYFSKEKKAESSKSVEEPSFQIIKEDTAIISEEVNPKEGNKTQEPDKQDIKEVQSENKEDKVEKEIESVKKSIEDISKQKIEPAKQAQAEPILVKQKSEQDPLKIQEISAEPLEQEIKAEPIIKEKVEPVDQAIKEIKAEPITPIVVEEEIEPVLDVKIEPIIKPVDSAVIKEKIETQLKTLKKDNAIIENKQEFRKSFFDDMKENITEMMEDPKDIEGWYKDKFKDKDLSAQMVDYWEHEKYNIIIKILSDNLKEKINNKFKRLRELEKDWLDIHFTLIEKEEELRKAEKELRGQISDFLEKIRV